MLVCETVISFGLVIANEAVLIQLFESVTVQKYLPATRLYIVSVYKVSLLTLFVHKYVKGDTPPTIFVNNEPSLPPKQLILSRTWIVSTVGFGCVTVKEFDIWHPEESVIVYDIGPAYILFGAEDQVSVYGGVPPEIVNDAVVKPPWQRIVPIVKLSIICDGSNIVTLSIAVQLFSSVNRHEYVPAGKESIIGVVAPFDHKKVGCWVTFTTNE